MSADSMPSTYPVRFSVDYPESLSRWLLFFRGIFAIPVFIIWYLLAYIGYIPLAAFFTIIVRRKYPRWWFDAVTNYVAFSQRILAYILLMRNEYPALEEDQAVHVSIDYPVNLNRWLPLVKWILALPHYLILIVLAVLACVAIFIAWWAILFTGRFPRGLFDFVEGVMRWSLRVTAYAFLLTTDDYPPFSMK